MRMQQTERLLREMIEEAKAELATLEKLCGSRTCEQYEDLSNFIETGHE